ncbi:MAG: GHKL domain-containing protein [Eubacteriales bacterium]|nr:GHKL domain-containing protein [Eubacteriales bacterium]
MLGWGINAVQAVLELWTGIGLYNGIYGERPGLKGGRKLGVLLLMAVVCLLDATDINVVGTMTVDTLVLLTGLLLGLWRSGGWLNAFLWGGFYRWTMNAVYVPILLIGGTYYGKSLYALNTEADIGLKLLSLLLTLLVAGAAALWRKSLLDCFRTILEHARWLLAVVMLMEYGIVLYFLNLVLNEAFTVRLSLWSMVSIGCVLSILASVLFFQQYRYIRRQVELLQSKDRIIQKDYERLSAEYAEARRTNHDHRHDLRYLEECLRNGDCEAGIRYIAQRVDGLYDSRTTEIWTGCRTVDYLLGSMKLRAKRQKVDFQVDVGLSKMKMSECDLFLLLSNLLENAFEAAEQCETDRYVFVKIKMVNDLTMICMENGYTGSIREKNGRFLSSKGEGTGNHGWGLENVKELVKKYGGQEKIEYADGKFAVEIMV